MEFVIFGVVFLGVLGGLWYYRQSVLTGLEEASDEFAEAVEEIREEVEEAEEFVEEVKEKLPTKNQLMKMKKDAIEEVGRKFGIELDKRFTKEKMVNTLHKEVKGK